MTHEKLILRKKDSAWRLFYGEKKKLKGSNERIAA
jgi:hypothetical protein